MNSRAKAWKKNYPPKRILAIRMHATGDVVITLPYLQYLRNNLPASTRLDFLTIPECESIPKNIVLFNNIYCIRGGRIFKRKFIHACLLLPKLFMQGYDVVIDLQDGLISRMVRKCL